MKIGAIDIEWLGHASFKIRNSALIYVDPFKIRETEKADIILITHEHFDHCSPDDIKRVSWAKTTIIAPADCASKLSGNIKTLKPGDHVQIGKISIEAVPAYNIDKSYHPKEKKWVGYVIDMNGQRVYHAGDTDVIPEMDNIKVDIAMLPVGGTYTMNVGEAAAAVEKIGPAYVIPMHYGSIVGDKKDGERLKAMCSCEVLLLQPSR